MLQRRHHKAGGDGSYWLGNIEAQASSLHITPVNQAVGVPLDCPGLAGQDDLVLQRHNCTYL